MSNLVKRSLSAIVLAPLFLYILYIGGLVFFWASLAMFLVIFYEWINLTSKAKHRIYWAIFGLIYIGVAFVTFIYLERIRPIDDYHGLTSPPILLFSIILLVWVNDSFAYFIGKTFGGPKLAPTISPNKTWSGSIGGVIGGVVLYFTLIGLVATPSYEIDDRTFYSGLALHIIIPIISQIGDLFESYMKRRFGVKDSGNIIPGHGGLFDRFDGLLLVLFSYGIFLYVVAYRAVAAQQGF